MKTFHITEAEKCEAIKTVMNTDYTAGIEMTDAERYAKEIKSQRVEAMQIRGLCDAIAGLRRESTNAMSHRIINTALTIAIGIYLFLGSIQP